MLTDEQRKNQKKTKSEHVRDVTDKAGSVIEKYILKPYNLLLMPAVYSVIQLKDNYENLEITQNIPIENYIFLWFSVIVSLSCYLIFWFIWQKLGKRQLDIEEIKDTQNPRKLEHQFQKYLKDIETVDDRTQVIQKFTVANPKDVYTSRIIDFKKKQEIG